MPERTLVCADPSYDAKGAELYAGVFGPHDHAVFRDRRVALERPWIPTCDDLPDIRGLSDHHRQFVFDIDYSAQVKRRGSGLLVASTGPRMTVDLGLRVVRRPRVRGPARAQPPPFRPKKTRPVFEPRPDP